MSTNKGYSDRPASLPLIEYETRLELPDDHHYYAGIPTSMSLDHSTQVRDNIHADDVVRAFSAFHANLRVAAVYNLGGGRESNVSMLCDRGLRRDRGTNPAVDDER